MNGTGNWDLVGNNTPIFFIRDPILFPSFIHTQARTDRYVGLCMRGYVSSCVYIPTSPLTPPPMKHLTPYQQKRNPATHCKDADMMWDFISLRPETTHQVHWIERDSAVGGRVSWPPAGAVCVLRGGCMRCVCVVLGGIGARVCGGDTTNNKNTTHRFLNALTRSTTGVLPILGPRHPRRLPLHERVRLSLLSLFSLPDDRLPDGSDTYLSVGEVVCACLRTGLPDGMV